MRTKEEITKKKSLSSGDSIPKEVIELQRLSRKRFFIILTIILTIGLSLIFVIYRQTRELFKQPIQINLPKIPKISLNNQNTTTSSLDNLTDTIAKFIKNDQSKWNIIVSNKTSVYNWPSNKTHFNQAQVDILTKKIATLAPSNSSANLFPQGLTISQQSTSTDQLQKLTILVNPPQLTLLFDFEYQGTQSDFQVFISQLIPALYWDTISVTP
jgi:hypothetical protein